MGLWSCRRGLPCFRRGLSCLSTVGEFMKVLGIVGWSGSGKTTLITRLIPILRDRGVRVATLKHAHHAFDVDQPGKDSYEHRKAGAVEVIVASSRRWVQMHEIGEGAEPTLSD